MTLEDLLEESQQRTAQFEARMAELQAAERAAEEALRAAVQRMRDMLTNLGIGSAS